MSSDDGLTFHVTITRGSKETLHYTGSRRAVLEWIDAIDANNGDLVTEVGMTATSPSAISAYLAAIRFGARRLDDASSDR